MPFPRINALRTIGATLAAAVVAIPLAQAGSFTDVIAGDPEDERVFLKLCHDQDGSSLAECHDKWVSLGMEQLESDAEYSARTGFHYGPRTGANAIAQCAPPHHMTRDGCQR
jgi:hypothetical protein